MKLMPAAWCYYLLLKVMRGGLGGGGATKGWHLELGLEEGDYGKRLGLNSACPWSLGQYLPLAVP